jgi:prepilin-type N-terminal cleavage/methylation domain-containing protein
VAGTGHRGRARSGLLADLHVTRAMRTRSEAGVTLMEVLVTMVLLSIALLGMAVAFPVGRAVVLQARLSTTAVTLAEQRLEQAKGTPYASLSTLAGTDTTTHPPYAVSTQVTADAPSAGMTTVTVTVIAPDTQVPLMADTGAKTVVLETFISGP